MSLEKINIRNSILVLIIIAAAATRLLHLGSLLGPWTNFTPIGAMAMFGGAYFSDKIKAYAIPLITLFISDLILNYSIYHKIDGKFDAAFWTYLSFIVMVFIGTHIKKVNVKNVVFASLAAVIAHWLISDIGAVLMTGSMYPKTFAGYLEALIGAIPFERNVLVGNLVYGLIMFGGFEFAKTKYPALKFNTSAELQHS